MLASSTAFQGLNTKDQPNFSPLNHLSDQIEGANESEFRVKIDLNREYQKHKKALCMLHSLKDIGFEWDIAFCK